MNQDYSKPWTPRRMEGAEGYVNWSVLDGCLKPGTRMMDCEGTYEHNGFVLNIEWKRPTEQMSEGQGYQIVHLGCSPNIIEMVVWGELNPRDHAVPYSVRSVEAIWVFHLGRVRKFENLGPTGVEKLRSLTNAWYRWTCLQGVPGWYFPPRYSDPTLAPFSTFNGGKGCCPHCGNPLLQRI